MTNQQKIEFYLSKGFAVEVKDGERTIKIIGIDKAGYYFGIAPNGGVDMWLARECFKENDLKITPIPPKPYEFKVGERVLITDGCNKGKIGIIEKQKEDFYSVKIDNQSLAYWPRTLSPPPCPKMRSVRWWR